MGKRKRSDPRKRRVTVAITELKKNLKLTSKINSKYTQSKRRAAKLILHRVSFVIKSLVPHASLEEWTKIRHLVANRLSRIQAAKWVFSFKVRRL